MQTKYDWSKAKPWAKFIAMDKDGNFYQFHKRPEKDHECWFLDCYGCDTCLPFFCEDVSLDWQSSLEQCPQVLNDFGFDFKQQTSNTVELGMQMLEEGWDGRH